MGNLPNTKVKEHGDKIANISLEKQNHPPMERGTEKPAPPSGG